MPHGANAGHAFRPSPWHEASAAAAVFAAYPDRDVGELWVMELPAGCKQNGVVWSNSRIASAEGKVVYQ